MRTEELRAGIYTNQNPHGCSGRVLSILFEAPPSEHELTVSAEHELRDSLDRYLEGAPSHLNTPAGKIRMHPGPAAGEELAGALQGWSYLADLATKPDPTTDEERDLHFGRYLLLGLRQELAFIVQARQGTHTLAAKLGIDVPVTLLPGEAWTAAWRAMQALERNIRQDRIDLASDAIRTAVATDAAYASALRMRMQ
ncbi:hypothetical protein CH275_16500 [Rhodococcus sp. 06-235-1A]|nr:hypothetical protein CH275_16500 [Rhodococcus sp. 06-235-1A]